jgi:group I intron endonuclease
LLPEYNLSKEPGSPFLGRKHSDKSRANLSDLNKGEKNPMYGKARSQEAGKPAHKIEVFDKETNKYFVFDSVNAAARALNMRQSSISRFIAKNQQEPHFFFKKNTDIFLKK